MIKIYVHNIFSEGLLKKLTHNSNNLKIESYENSTYVFCTYKNENFNFIFNPIISYNEDGMHLIDYWSVEKDATLYKNYLNFSNDDLKNQDTVYKKIYEKIENKSKWIFLVIRTEKMLSKIDLPELNFPTKDEFYLSKMENNFIINDGYFLDKSFQNLYPNFYYVFTNTVFQWNHYCGIHWYYDFGQIYSNLKFDYDLSYSVRKIKGNRKNILKELSSLKNNKIYLSVTDYGGNELTRLDKHYEDLKNLNIHFNLLNSQTDFSDVSYIPNFKCPGVDVFLRVLPKSKMQILDESWAYYKKDYIHQYLSEKTLGLILAGIPFISTHYYPLDIIQNVLNLEPHPFYNDTKDYCLDTKKFKNFVENFMKNFDENYKICLDWSNIAKEKMMERLNSKNDLLELIINKELQITKKSNSLI